MNNEISEILEGKYVSESVLSALEEKVQAYPFCASYQLALAKMLYSYKRENYESRLGELSMYAPSRKWLWNFVNAPVGKEEIVTQELTQVVQEINSPRRTDVAEVVPQETEAQSQLLEQDDDGELFSETLARIYIKQMKYEHAIKIFEKLSLKFPEKSIYFADQIRFLRIIIENNKK